MFDLKDADLFIAIGDEPAVLEFGIVVARLPLQGFYAVFRPISRWVFANDPENFGFRHPGLESGKPFVHLTAGEH